MTTEKIISTVTEVAQMMDVHPQQHKPLQRYFLHKRTELSLDEIARATEGSKTQVYGSIERIEKSKNLERTKAMIFAALK